MLALWGPEGTQVSQSPDTVSGFPGLSGLVLGLFVASLILVAWRRRKGTPGVRGSAGGTAVGNAFMDLNSAFMPNHANSAVICMLEEEEVRDEAGEGPTPWTSAPKKIESPYRADNKDDDANQRLN